MTAENSDNTTVAVPPQSPGSASGSCPTPYHTFAVAGLFLDERVPEGWSCLCGQTVAKWKTCDMGHEHLIAEALGQGDHCPSNRAAHVSSADSDMQSVGGSLSQNEALSNGGQAINEL